MYIHPFVVLLIKFLLYNLLLHCQLVQVCYHGSFCRKREIQWIKINILREVIIKIIIWEKHSKEVFSMTDVKGNRNSTINIHQDK